jgi:polysaccharide export outer membrane protein
MAEKVYIMGEVMKPGEYVIEDRNVTVIESIGMAGEFTRIAAPNRTTIIRIENGRERIITVPVDDITQKGLRSKISSCATRTSSSSAHEFLWALFGGEKSG